MDTGNLKEHLNLLKIKDIKNLIRQYNLHYKIKLSQKKPELISDLLKHFEDTITDNNMTSKKYEATLPKIEEPKPPKAPRKPRIKKDKKEEINEEAYNKLVVLLKIKNITLSIDLEQYLQIKNIYELVLINNYYKETNNRLGYKFKELLTIIREKPTLVEDVDYQLIVNNLIKSDKDYTIIQNFSKAMKSYKGTVGEIEQRFNDRIDYLKKYFKYHDFIVGMMRGYHVVGHNIIQPKLDSDAISDKLLQLILVTPIKDIQKVLIKLNFKDRLQTNKILLTMQLLTHFNTIEKIKSLINSLNIKNN